MTAWEEMARVMSIYRDHVQAANLILAPRLGGARQLDVDFNRGVGAVWLRAQMLTPSVDHYPHVETLYTVQARDADILGGWLRWLDTGDVPALRGLYSGAAVGWPL